MLSKTKVNYSLNKYTIQSHSTILWRLNNANNFITVAYDCNNILLTSILSSVRRLRYITLSVAVVKAIADITNTDGRSKGSSKRRPLHTRRSRRLSPRTSGYWPRPMVSVKESYLVSVLSAVAIRAHAFVQS